MKITLDNEDLFIALTDYFKSRKMEIDNIPDSDIQIRTTNKSTIHTLTQVKSITIEL